MSDEVYDGEAARRELDVYRTDAAARRRAFVRDRLALSGDETVLSLGCGPGLEPRGLADALGPAGRVLGVDASHAMLALARERCADRDAVSLALADATDLPLRAGAVDAATAVQVLEYVDDVAAALASLRRVLRPDGRAVLLDTDWRTFVWRADDDALSAAVLDAWTDRYPHPRLGSELASRLRAAGFAVETVEPFPVVERTLDGFFGHNLPFLVDHAAGHDAVGPDAAERWREDLEAREERGETFVSLTQYCYVVRPQSSTSSLG